MLLQNQGFISEKSKKSVKNTPEYYINALKSGFSPNDLRGVRVELTSSPMTWVQKFLELGGLSLITGVLYDYERKYSSQSPEERSSETELIIFDCVTCIKAIMNSPVYYFLFSSGLGWSCRGDVVQ